MRLARVPPRVSMLTIGRRAVALWHRSGCGIRGRGGSGVGWMEEEERTKKEER
jgi:hypothetical protein